MKDISLYGHLTVDTLLDGDTEKKTLGSMANVWKALVELDCSLKIGLSPIDIGQALIYIDKQAATRVGKASLNLRQFSAKVLTSKVHHLIYLNEMSKTDFIPALDGIITADVCPGKPLRKDLLQHVDYLFISDEDCDDFAELVDATKRLSDIAGATGAGKSVFLNSLLVSLMVKNTPNNLKLLLVDPKQLEFALYESLPHLIMPVVTESSKAKIAFSWVIQEMERRYSILKELSVRSIDGFNEKVRNGLSSDLIKSIQSYYEPESSDFFLPYVVVVVDEFADLILSKNGKDIENMVCRLAAKARASGIHLVLATQRPSVDVITGLIKSNFPTRVSFKVSTSVDSRTILNSMGAEFLLGKGDMLFKSGIETSRVHSAFVAEKEIEFLLDGLQGIPQSFNKSIIDFLEDGDCFDEGRGHGSRGEFQEKVDELFEEALSIVMTHNLASASMLQRRLKIGYNRAANLIEEMEARGIVGKADGPKPRKVLNNKIDL